MRLAEHITFKPPGPGGIPLASKVAAVDLRSTPFKAVLGEIQGERIVTRPLEQHPMGVGMQVAKHRGLIDKEMLTETSRALTEFKCLCEREGSTEILAVVTRAARNGEEIIQSARELGFAVEIATDEREAELAYLAVTGGKPGKFVCELGSHGMQLAWRDSAQIESISVAVGYERAYRDFIRNARCFAQAYHAYAAFLDGEVRGLPYRSGEFIGIAMNTVACFVTGQHKPQVSNCYLSHTCIREKLRALGALTRAGFTALKATTPKADNVFSSLILLDRMLKRTGHEWVYVAKSELPVGLIIEYFEGAASR